MKRRRFTSLSVTSSVNISFYLNKAKAVYISFLALCNYHAPITSQVSSKVVNY